MSTSKRREVMLRALCAQPGEDDGLPFSPRKAERAADTVSRKDLQLCKLASRVISNVLDGQAADPLLQSLIVDRVEPGDGPGDLRVVVTPKLAVYIDDVVARARLVAIAPFVRSELARTANRKRVPTFSFLVLPPGSAVLDSQDLHHD